MRKFLNIAAVLLLLVGFPLGSYFYMKHGFEYRRKAIEAQGDFGTMPNLNDLRAMRGQLPDQLRGSMVVVGWLNPENQEASAVYGRSLDSLYNQFADSPNLYFTTITTGDSSFVGDWAETYQLPEDEMLSVIGTDQDGLRQSARDFQLPVAPGVEPVVALVDSSLTIRKFYDLRQREEAIGLVQLISLIIPLPEKGDVVLDPKKEL